MSTRRGTYNNNDRGGGGEELVDDSCAVCDQLRKRLESLKRENYRLQQLYDDVKKKNEELQKKNEGLHERAERHDEELATLLCLACFPPPNNGGNKKKGLFMK